MKEELTELERTLKGCEAEVRMAHAALDDAGIPQYSGTVRMALCGRIRTAFHAMAATRDEAPRQARVTSDAGEGE